MTIGGQHLLTLDVAGHGDCKAKVPHRTPALAPGMPMCGSNARSNTSSCSATAIALPERATSMPEFDVSVIGLYILDVLGRPIDAIPPGGEVAFIDEIRLTVAGTAGGTAVDCAKLGLHTRAVGAVGADEKADFVLATLARYGVDTAAMQRLLERADLGHDPERASRTATGRRCMRAARPTTFTLGTRPTTRRRWMPGSSIWAAPGLLAALDGTPTVRLLTAARARKCVTTYDLIAANAGTLDLVRPALPYVDYFIPSIEEARAMCPLSDAADIARFFRDLGVGTCVLTRGGDGMPRPVRCRIAVPVACVRRARWSIRPAAATRSAPD